MKTKNNISFFSNLKSVLIAVFIAILIRSFIAEPFNIPSGSMKPNLLVGDFIFVSKWSYGYSRHSLPFSLNIIPNKIFSSSPKRGDVVVFKTPEDNRTDYIKRVIGLPGDKIKIVKGQIILNDNLILRQKNKDFIDNDSNAPMKRVRKYKEFFDDFEIEVLDMFDYVELDNTKEFIVPPENFFVMGDNRDNSSDSRILNVVGFVPFDNLNHSVFHAKYRRLEFE